MEMIFIFRYFLQNALYVGLFILFLKHDMLCLNIRFFDSPQADNFMGRGVRNDKRIQNHLGIPEPLLNFFNGLIKLHLGIIQSDITQSLGINEGDILLVFIKYPEDKVRIEIAGFEKTNAFPFTEVS